MGSFAPDRIALIGPGGEQETFGELATTTNRIANGLRDLGLGVGDVVASLLHNSLEHFEVSVATNQVGMYVVPVNVHLTPAEAAYIIVDSGAKVLVAAADLAKALDQAGVVDLPERRFVVGAPVAGWRPYSELRSSGAPTAPTERTFGWIMGYTSGTTGRPKGVRRQAIPVEPEVIITGSAQFMADFGILRDGGVHLVCSPLYHAAPGNFAQQHLHLGHTLVIQRGFDAEGVLADIEKYRVTTSQMVPTHLHRIMRLPTEVRDKYDVSSLRTLLVAGSAFAPEAKRAVIEWIGPAVWEYLASTEGIVCTVSSPEALARPGTVGRPAAVKIIDADGAEVGPGEAGTIYFPVASPFEYLNDPDKTRAARHASGYATAGDLGRLDEDGYLYLLDRREDLVISGGVNIYPAEVEQRLGLHPAVADVAVVGAPDPEWGERVIAVVQVEPGWTPGPELSAELNAHCRAGLASSKCPKRYEFRSALPRTPAGKLLRRVLRQELRDPLAQNETRF
jgi:long-chain acyl-CoA synthetase